MLRKLTIALVVLAVSVLPLTATCVLTADATQQTASNTCGHLTVPFAGIFSGTSAALAGGTSDVGTGLFTICGWSQVHGSQVTGTYPPQPYKMTIITAAGDTISLQVSPGSSTYQIYSGTGRLAHVVGGSGHFSLQRSLNGLSGTFKGHLDGTIVFAS